MHESIGLLTILITVASAWLAIAVALSIMAARRVQRANAVLDAARLTAGLLAESPARALIVGTDDRIEVDADLVRDLGLPATPVRLDDLSDGDNGIDPADLATLRLALGDTRMTAQPIEVQLRAVGSGRVFDVRGGPAPAPSPAGATLLWLTDATRSFSQRAGLARRLAQSEGALNSLTHLIESAPFPMWYRGPDLRLGLVNSAFVRAVEGQDAADVITRGTELIDGETARAGAARAMEAGEAQSRNMPATIDGERRMLRIVDVPLATGAVAGFAIDVQELEDARSELARNIQSQRELADRMTAGTAQFDADRRLSFFNQPFAIMTQLDRRMARPKIPSSTGVIERDARRAPHCRRPAISPAWKDERRAWFTSRRRQ